MIFILLCWATIAAMLSEIQAFQNVAQFLSMMLYFAGVLIWIILLLMVFTGDQWGKGPPKKHPLRSKIVRLSLLCVVCTLAAYGWYWSATAWIWWWLSIEAISFSIRQHWKMVQEKAAA